MSAYRLSHSETWSLATLLHLPIQPGSVLENWLSLDELPDHIDRLDENLEGLKRKGIYSPSTTRQSLPDELVSALTLISINAAESTLILRRNGRAVLSRFAHAGKFLGQYGIEKGELCLHPVAPQAGLAEKIIPEWFLVSHYSPLALELQPGAFLLFKQACDLADLAAAETGFASEQFRKDQLLSQPKLYKGWLDVFTTIGSNEGDLEHLISRRLLLETQDGYLSISQTAKALAATLSDPDLCSLMISLQTVEKSIPVTGTFLFGSGQLFLLETNPGVFMIRQLANRQESCLWVQNLLTQSSQARHTEYVTR